MLAVFQNTIKMANQRDCENVWNGEGPLRYCPERNSLEEKRGSFWAVRVAFGWRLDSTVWYGKTVSMEKAVGRGLAWSQNTLYK